MRLKYSTIGNTLKLQIRKQVIGKDDAKELLSEYAARKVVKRDKGARDSTRRPGTSA
jgi:hypothetical protein